ncbi:hypothetical protein D3C83_164270 [compost metagenome]
MKVVRSATFGIRARMLSSSRTYDWRVPGRFIRFKTASDACWSGRSMYFTTLGRPAIASMTSAVMVVG